MKYVIAGLVLLLMILHHDTWNWHRHEPLIFGVIPIGLAHHVGISLAAGLVWLLAVLFVWPREVDQIEAEAKGQTPTGTADNATAPPRTADHS